MNITLEIANPAIINKFIKLDFFSTLIVSKKFNKILKKIMIKYP